MQQEPTMEERIKQLEAALQKIANLNPGEDSDEGYNEWGEADCFRQAQNIAEAALKV